MKRSWYPLLVATLILHACGSDEPARDESDVTESDATESDATESDAVDAVSISDAESSDTSEMDSDAEADVVESDTTTGEDANANSDAEDVSEVDAADGETDVEEDVDESGCIRATIDGIWSIERADDVSIGFNGFFEPTIDGYSAQLTLLFERYSPGPDVGVFELGPGTADENYGNCAHCIVIQSAGTTAFFASEGSLETREDPYSRFLDVSVSGLKLVEVDVDPVTRESTTIEGGRCVIFDDFQATQNFPATGWTCPDEQYNDGAICHCDCGDVDPDCNPTPDCFPLDPDCEAPEPLPVENCEETEVCAFDPEAFSLVCTEPCDWSGGAGCGVGTCVYDFGVGDGDLCLESDERVDGAALGETCAPESPYQQVCHVVDGFARGWCDFDGTCQPLCQNDDECTEPTHTCRLFTFDGDLGYCGPEPVDEE